MSESIINIRDITFLDSDKNVDLLVLTETKTFNLAKAQKYLDKLKNKLNLNTINNRRNTNSYINNTKYFISLSEINNLISSEEELKENYNKKINNVVLELESKLNLIKDYKNLKNTIYTENTKCGINNILTKIDLLEEEKNIYESFISSIKDDDVKFLSDNKIGYLYEKLKSLTENDLIDTIKLRIFNLEKLKEKVKLINKELEDLENKRDRLNANTNITFTFYKETLNLIGL